MVQLPIINGRQIGDPHKDKIAAEYCNIIQNIFFKEHIWNGTPEFNVTVPFSFLLYTNGQPEFRNFMALADTWEFLNSLTRDSLYIFSLKPEKVGQPFSKEEEDGVLTLSKIFGLGGIMLNPHLILCDFDFTHKKGDEDWEHIYDARITNYYSFKLENTSPEGYIKMFREVIAPALVEVPASIGTSVEKLVNEIVNRNKANSFTNLLSGVFDKRFSIDFAKALTLFTWKPKTLKS